ncbi:MAG: YmdB family metallophosphoesterase [Spirochaetes bacterium]|nr:YmdB family metallophosphoesterase [Spirochaetota bacterium]
MKIARVAMIGDVVGDDGLEALEAGLPPLVKEQNIDFVTVNGENAAEGFGLSQASLKRILAAGADIVTSGNHVWEKRDFWPYLQAKKQILRPANYPPNSPGAGWAKLEKDGLNWLVINLQGREFMSLIDCPFSTFDNIMEDAGGGAGRLVLVDFHAESTREKEALAYYLDGRAAVIAGTHTHVQTADERVLPKGSAYITDLGMSGNTDSVIGMDPEICLARMRKQVLYKMECAQKSEKAEIQGIIAELDAGTGKALSIRRINCA